MFIMGIVLDYSNVWPDAKCVMNPGERNYNVCFFMFALMMFIAFLVATQIQFRYTSYVKPEIPLGQMQNGGSQKVETSKLIIAFIHFNIHFLFIKYLNKNE